MSVKYFCDKCNKELTKDELQYKSKYAESTGKLLTSRITISAYSLCKKCFETNINEEIGEHAQTLIEKILTAKIKEG